MDFFETQDLFKEMYPGRKIVFEFDEKCLRKHEIIYTDGKPHSEIHAENNKVKVSVEGQKTVYVPISPHREICSLDQIKASLDLMGKSWFSILCGD